MSEQWDLILTFPNLSPIPTRFESDGYVSCSGKDSRLDSLADTPANVTAYKLLTRFRTARNDSYVPGCFLIRADIPIPSREREAIRSFRNLCALATTTTTYAIRLKTPNGAQWRVLWSDQFRFGYFTAGKDGWGQTLDGPAIAIDDQIPWMQPAAYFGNPQNWPVYVDDPLLDRLKECWRTYLRRQNRVRLLRLFRSLEVAFYASLFPADGLTSINASAHGSPCG